MKIDHISLSYLTRTRQKYNVSFDKYIRAILTPLLSERSLGIFVGRKVSEVEQDRLYAAYFGNGAYHACRHSFTQKAPEGESYEDLLKRVEAFFKNEVVPSLESIVIIAHQVVIR